MALRHGRHAKLLELRAAGAGAVGDHVQKRARAADEAGVRAVAEVMLEVHKFGSHC
jgi:hypothetical protein